MCSLFGEICIVQKVGTANVWAYKLEPEEHGDRAKAMIHSHAGVHTIP